MPLSARTLTYDDFVGFPDDGRRHELMGGEHVVTPAPNAAHQRVSVDLVAALADYLERSGAGEVFHAPFDVVLSSSDVVEPDLLIVLADQSGIVTDLHVKGAPAIVVEILSSTTSRRDLGVKRQIYVRAGVREYWVVDAARRAVRVFSMSQNDATKERRLEAARGEALTSSWLPEFSLPLVRLFRRTR